MEEIKFGQVSTKVLGDGARVVLDGIAAKQAAAATKAGMAPTIRANKLRGVMTTDGAAFAMGTRGAGRAVAENGVTDPAVITSRWTRPGGGRWIDGWQGNGRTM